MTAAPTPTVRSSWSLIVNALADLGAREIERRKQAQQAADDTPRRDDTPHTQHDDQAAGGDVR
jgi:hypothetical protein